MKILAVDPGVTTGWVYWKDEIIDAGEDDQQHFCHHSYYLTRYVDVVVCEDYRITASTTKKTFQPASLEIIGCLRWFCHENVIPFVLQPASEKSFMSDKKLRALYWWLRGNGHARDAARHLGVYLAKVEKNLDVLSAR